MVIDVCTKRERHANANVTSRRIMMKSVGHVRREVDNGKTDELK